MIDIKSRYFFEYPLYGGERSEAKQCLRDILVGNHAGAFSVLCLNPHSFVVADSDPVFKASLANADLLVPDGVGVKIGAKILGVEVKERITGYDVFEDAMAILNDIKGSVFFIGGSEDTLDKISKRLSIEYPDVVLAGAMSPPFVSSLSDSVNENILGILQKVRPDILWVGMTAPKQEKWIYQMLGNLPVKVVGGIGAVFDFYGKTVRRAPPVISGLGLEWLWRLISQPSRVWKRIFLTGPIFLWRVGKSKIGQILSQADGSSA